MLPQGLVNFLLAILTIWVGGNFDLILLRPLYYWKVTHMSLVLAHFGGQLTPKDIPEPSHDILFSERVCSADVS